MNESEKTRAISFAKVLITEGSSKGTVKSALMDHFSIPPNVAGRIVRTAVHQLYDSNSKVPLYWLAQDCGSSTPLQRRLARRRFRELLERKARLARARVEGGNDGKRTRD